MIKIISGKYKGLVIPSTENNDFRPTTNKVKQAMFNILFSKYFNIQDIKNQNVLDLCSGAGGLGFEALSRGFSNVTFVDINPNYIKNIKNFAKKIQAEDKIFAYEMDATKLKHLNRKQYNLIFIDPPYNANLVLNILKSLKENMDLTNSYIMVETAKNFIIDFECNILLEKTYGVSKITLLQLS
jgi:16S rRNA (guanine966-N2)-methyltransferase